MIQRPFAAPVGPLLLAGALGCAGAASPPADRPQTSAPATASEEPAAEAPEPAPGPPATDILLVDFDTSAVPWVVRATETVTDRHGYDNQPCFESDGMGLLYSSYRDGQTDIYRHAVGGGSPEQMTATAESEYSPTPIPGWPGFSTVRVEADGTQRLWRVPYSGQAPEPVFETIAPVGYHAWIGPRRVVLFVLGDPHALVLAELGRGETRTLATETGRALHRVPGKEAVSFVDRSDEDSWHISWADVDTGRTQSVLRTPAGSEDFVWRSEREILIGSGSKLLLHRLSSDGWVEVADLKELGVAGITRLAVAPNGDRIALVFQRPTPEGEPSE